MPGKKFGTWGNDKLYGTAEDDAIDALGGNDLIWGEGGDDLIYTTTTGANGIYGFSNLPSGNLRADVNPASLPSNLAATYDLNGAPDGSATRALTIGENATDVDFGYRGPASIGDTVWNDVDGNGAQNIWAKPMRPQGEPRAITRPRYIRAMRWQYSASSI